MFLLGALVLLAPTISGFAPPRVWSLGFASGSRIALVGDVDHDGYADLIAVNRDGDCSIDVNLTVEGFKPAGGSQAIANWGKNCQAAAGGEIDDVPGCDVVGIFEGKTLRLAGAFANGHFKDTPNWATLPRPLAKPALAALRGGKTILAFSTGDGAAYEVDSRTKGVTPCHVPAGMTWIGDEGDRLVGQEANGDIYWLDRQSLRRGDKLGSEPKGWRPAAADGLVAFAGKAWTAAGTLPLEPSALPPANSVLGVGAIDPEGDEAIFEFRYGSEPHTGDQILMRRAIIGGAASAKATAPKEESDAYNRESSNDGLLDGWKLYGYRGLDMKAMGCSPGHADVICLISRFENVKEERLKSEIDHVVKFYGDLKVKNADGTPGIHFHPIYLDPIKGADMNNPWWVNRDKFLPPKWRGIVHWMQVTPGGGGQANELSDGGTCGEGALWAVFSHEFGHQLGLNHEGFWPNGNNPLYTSLMNYTYSYGFEDDRNKIHFSDGSFSGLVLRETDLDETLPYPYEKVKFLEKGPYHFKLKPNGNTTLIDWNWNGVFGEKHIRADINYAYSTTAGTRDTVGKVKTAPCLFVHDRQAFVLYGTNELPSDKKTDPSLSAERPGRLELKRLKKPTVWDGPWVLESGGLIGDPVAASFGGKIVAVYPTDSGVVARSVDVGRSGITMSNPELLSPDKTLVPTIAPYSGRLFIFLTNPESHVVTYQVWQEVTAAGRQGVKASVFTLDVPSTNPVGLCTDTLTGEAVLGLAQDQDAQKTNRWQIRRYRAGVDGKLMPSGQADWIEGPSGGSRGTGRLTTLFDGSKDAGAHGRVYLFGKGMTGKDNPWSCTYVAMQVADKTVRGGWLVKRYYDEWSQTRSAPGAAWFNNDVIFGYRWVAGDQSETDNNLHVGYQGLGIQSEPMGDFDDIGFIRNFGLANSILNLGRG